MGKKCESRIWNENKDKNNKRTNAIIEETNKSLMVNFGDHFKDREEREREKGKKRERKDFKGENRLPSCSCSSEKKGERNR